MRETKEASSQAAWSQWLKIIRATYDLKQDELGVVVGKSRALISYYERGERVIRQSVVDAILRRFPDAPRPAVKDIQPRQVEGAMPERASVPFYKPNARAEVAIWEEVSGKTGVPPELAIGRSFAMSVADYDMAPRFLPGQQVVCRAFNLYDDGLYVVAEHPGRLVVDGHTTPRPRVYIRRYTYETGKLLLTSRNADAESFEAKDLELIGAVIGILTVHGKDWYTLEARSRGLLFDPPNPR
jgi:transcriptional regulator with XRE-family HTH domain